MRVETASDPGAQFAPTEAAPLESLFGISSSTLRYVEEQPPRAAPAPVAAARVATFLYARLHNFAAACQTLSGPELTSFVNEVRRLLTDAVLKLGGEIAQRKPDSVLAVFSDRPEDRKPNHAQRGLHAAILTVYEAVQLANKVAVRPRSAGLPPLSLAVGVHLGPGEVTPRTTGAAGMVHAVGESVEIARLLEVTAADMHWSVVTSAATRLAASGRVQAGRTGSLGLPDDTFIDIVEVGGLVPRKGSTTPASYYETLGDALQQNQKNSHAAAAGKAAGGGHLLIEGYRLLRKIGEGGIASVFLAQPLEGGAPQVLKVLRLDSEDGVMGLQRFMQEFALVAQIDHPNVARIIRQDFSAGSAYIAMEYFPLGDLRQRLRRPVDPGIAMYYLRQIAAGLDAIHQAGIVHRDLKPDNLMVRQDGTLAITDFGVAKQVSMKITDTGDGEIVGTPYYLSPEQALGRPVDARCDIYSLGVVAYEMLMGEKPYHAATAEALLLMHVNAPVPLMSVQHKRMQPVLERMMAKDPAQRYPSARALLDDLDRLGK